MFRNRSPVVNKLRHAPDKASASALAFAAVLCDLKANFLARILFSPKYQANMIVKDVPCALLHASGG
jgi:hypothetical protein